MRAFVSRALAAITAVSGSLLALGVALFSVIGRIVSRVLHGYHPEQPVTEMTKGGIPVPASYQFAELCGPWERGSRN